MMEYDIHTVLDFLTLIATVWVIYTLRIPLKDTYQEEQDSVQTYSVVRNLPILQIVVIPQMSNLCGPVLNKKTSGHQVDCDPPAYLHPHIRGLGCGVRFLWTH